MAEDSALTQTAAFPAPSHDHDACIDDAVARAESVCAERGERLTPLRRRVLELVWENHRPSRAYDLLEKLQAERAGAAPPTVYRTLEFLQQLGLVHRIESLNAFVGCDGPDGSHAGEFLICEQCGAVAELAEPEVAAVVARAAARTGFRVRRQTVEAFGTCPDCAGRA
ncbi:MAG: Fur family transcriptional regulator [Pseudomonadota bacterium]|nr:Fur family transcriptional regulator [Pseudomonadota bacterium]